MVLAENREGVNGKLRYSRCGPGLDLSEADGPSGGLGCFGQGVSLGGANPSDLVIRMADNTVRGLFPLAGYGHAFNVFPGWACPGGQAMVVQSRPGPGVEERTLDSLLANRHVKRVHIHWLLVSEESVDKARNLALSMKGRPYSWKWLLRWYLHHRCPLFPIPDESGIVCGVFSHHLLHAVGYDPWNAYTPNELYRILYRVPSCINEGLPQSANLQVDYP